MFYTATSMQEDTTIVHMPTTNKHHFKMHKSITNMNMAMDLAVIAIMIMRLSKSIIIMNKNNMLTNNAAISMDTVTSMKTKRKKSINVATNMVTMTTIMSITKVIAK